MNDLSRNTKKTIEEDQHRREREYASLVENMTDLIARFDTNLRYTYCNPIFERLGSRPISTYLGRTILEVGARKRESVIVLDRAARQVLETGEIQQVEHDLLTKFGFRHYQTRVIPERDEEGCIISLFSIGRDITEHKEMEDALRQSEERYQNFIANSFEGIYRTEFDQPIDITLPIETQIDLIYENAYMAECNDALAQMYGFSSAKSLLGARLIDVHGGKDNPVNRMAYRKLIENGYKSINDETLEYDSTGKPTWFLNNTVGIIENGFLVRSWGTCIDITERKRVEEREREQRTLAEALRDAVEALNSSLRLDDILDKILDHIERVVPYDAMTVTWIQGDQIRVVRCRGYTLEQEKFIYQQSIAKNELSIFTQTVATHEPLIIPDVSSYPLWKQAPQIEWVRSHVKVPIITNETVIGFISLSSKTLNFYNPIHARNLQTFANQVAIAVRNAQLYEEVQSLATRDELTGLYNRRGFSEICRREIGRSQRFGRTFSVLFSDIDHFKQFNDRYSYEVGDQVLRLVAETLQCNVREIDVVGRFGGEEMVVLLPEHSQTGAEEIAERLRKAVENLRMPHNQENLQVTVSIGVATTTYVPGQTIPTTAEKQIAILDDLIGKAGSALHTAKQQGRNRVVVYNAG